MAKKETNPIIEGIKYILCCILLCALGIFAFAMWFVDYFGLFFGIAFDVVFFGVVIFWIFKTYQKTRFLWLVYFILASIVVGCVGLYLDLVARSQIPEMQDKPSYVKRILN